MRIYSQGPGEAAGRGNRLDISYPGYDDRDFYADAIGGRIRYQYKRLRKYNKLDKRDARSVVWQIVFAMHMATPMQQNGATKFTSYKDVEAEHAAA